MVSAWQPSVGRGGSRPARGRSAGDRGVPRRAEEGGVAIGWSGLLATNDLIQARVVDDDVRRHGQHREGLFLSAFGVFSRLTGATAGLGLGSLGLLFGYYSGEDPGPDPGTAFCAQFTGQTKCDGALRMAGDTYPAWVQTHYLQLPDSVTDRTREKARQIVQQANAINPYDQARAIQDYLRTLVYDESRVRPPDDRDWADYFLFSSQRGYCDDFATAMVVMLRSLNVPARLAQGYAGGALDPQLNAYVVRESVGHSWPEVYFPGYGWQRFEPTPSSAGPTVPPVPSSEWQLMHS